MVNFITVKMITLLKNLKFKTSIQIIFSFCLLYQTYLLIQQFFKFNRVIDIKLSANVIDSLPAITFCYNRLYSFEKLVQHYASYKNVYENYNKFLDEYDSENPISENVSNLFLTENQFFQKYYWKIIKEQHLDLPRLFSGIIFSPEEIFNNLTLGFEDLNSTDYQSYNNRIINIYLYGENIMIDGFLEFKDEFANASVFVWKLIESIYIYEELELLKCFTFFDEIQIPLSKNKLNVDYIFIAVKFLESWFPFDPKAGISVAIHSPKVIPERDLFVNLEQNTKYRIYLSKLDDIRLSNYDNCLDRHDTRYYEDTRNYCLDKCFNETISSDCFEKFTMSRPTSLRRYQFLGWNKTNARKCENLATYKTFKETSRPCYNKCEEDCYQTHYFVDIENVGKDKPGILTSNNIIQTEIQPNSRPNILIEHFLEMTFVSLICNFGGLIGMYLGISLQSVCCDIWQMTKKIFMKFVWVKILNRNNNLILIGPININLHV